MFRNRNHIKQVRTLSFNRLLFCTNIYSIYFRTWAVVLFFSCSDSMVDCCRWLRKNQEDDNKPMFTCLYVLYYMFYMFILIILVLYVLFISKLFIRVWGFPVRTAIKCSSTIFSLLFYNFINATNYRSFTVCHKKIVKWKYCYKKEYKQKIPHIIRAAP